MSLTTHYLYFRNLNSAREAEAVVRERSLETVVEEAALGDDWALLVSSSVGKLAAEFDAERNFLEGVARRFSGEYDGWETAVGAGGVERG